MEEVRNEEPDFELQDSKKRLKYIMLAPCVMMIFVLLATAYLQLIRGGFMLEKAEGQMAVKAKVISPRGTIVDTNGQCLAVSSIVKSLYVNPSAVPDKPEYWPKGKMPKRNPAQVAADKFSPILEIPAAKLYKMFTRPNTKFFWVKRTLEPQDSERIEQIIKKERLNGFHFLRESKRYYPQNQLGAQILGFVGTDDKGLEGIERSQDKYVRGQISQAWMYYDGKGNKVGDSALNPVEAPKMNELQLTIDSRMQFILEQGLEEAMESTHAIGAAAILMDPNTGAILGMASRPTFNPNEFGKSTSSNWSNRAVTSLYEPGSVFKPIIACAGLMEGVITPNTPFDDEGTYNAGGRIVKNWNGKGMGQVTYTDVLKYSINTGMVDLGLKLGGKKMNEYARAFGFGKPTGSDVSGEASGILYNPKYMVPSDAASMSIGQGIAVTPLQMINAISAIANGGELLRPYIVKKIVAPDGTVIKENKREVVRRVISPEVASQMRTMMEQVVSGGGGTKAQIKGYEIAGKTGTAEKLSPTGGYAKGKYIASFVGFVPADKPRYAMLILIDTPQGTIYGGQISAPIFRDTLQQILVAEGVQPSNNAEITTLDSLAVNIAQKSLPKVVQKGDNRTVPNLEGLNMRQVAEVLGQGDLQLIPYGTGQVVNQKPMGGQEVTKNTVVEVWFKQKEEDNHDV